MKLRISFYKALLDKFIFAAIILLATPTWANAELTSLDVFKPALSEDFIALLRKADLTAGEKVFMRKCSSCHDHAKSGGHGKGPHLWNLIPRVAGTMEGFDFSDAMRNSGHIWTFATLNYYLTRTDRAVPGRSMDFRGIRSDEVRANLLRFLQTLHDQPPALP